MFLFRDDYCYALAWSVLCDEIRTHDIYYMKMHVDVSDVVDFLGDGLFWRMMCECR